MFNITRAAAQQIQQSAQSSGAAEMALRVAAKRDTVLDFVELNPGEFNFVFIPPNHPSSGGGSVTTTGCGSGGCGSCASKGTTH